MVTAAYTIREIVFMYFWPRFKLYNCDLRMVEAAYIIGEIDFTYE